MKILVLNSGSSSQKTALFDLSPQAADPASPLWEGKLEWDGSKETITVTNSDGKKFREESRVLPEKRGSSLGKMLDQLWQPPTGLDLDRKDIAAVGHRIVHGGPRLTEPAIVTPEVKRAIASVSAIAPLHNIAGLDGIEYSEGYFPKVPQIAVFDTAFHSTLPLAAKVYPGPYEWYEQGIWRYGFHGINHAYCATRAARLLGRDLASLKTVTCHLGNGCSLAAVADGRSMDTTMGFSPLEGLMMGTRPGSLDPGILTHLLRSRQITQAELDEVLNHQSGLLGISGISSDMRDILAAVGTGNERARLAFDIFIHRLQSGIAAMAGSLAGLDALVFSAGIGENSPEIRTSCCERLAFLGIELDQTKNSLAIPDVEVSSPGSRVRTLVIRAQEDLCIAQTAMNLLSPC
ncbi:MAG: acetate kinase [Acidobacteria bacterium]|nr:acetate kinase [Acidobacteriota bacterium]